MSNEEVRQMINNEDELRTYLKKLNIDIDMYSYKSDMNDEYLMNHPWVMKDRVYYDNPGFWRTIFDKNIEPAIEFLMNDYRVSANNLGICNTCLYTDRDETYTLCERHLNTIDDKKEKSIDMNNFMWILVQRNKVDRLKTMISLAEKLNIEPIHKNWGNIAYGDGISESVKFDDSDMFNFLIQFKPSPELNESMPYCIACKYGYYTRALALVNIGYNPKTMNNLGLKMIKRNDTAKLALDAENAISRKSLLALYGETEK